MTLQDLKDTLASLPAHALADTNVDSVEIAGTDVVLVIDASETAERIAELEAELKEREAELAKAEADLDEFVDKSLEARKALADLKDPDSGVTVATMLERMGAAEGRVKTWQERAQKSDTDAATSRRELLALRKRKGVECGVVRHAGEVVLLLRQAAGGMDPALCKGRAAELLKAIETC